MTRHPLGSLLSLVALVSALVACTERHRLGGRYDDAYGGEAGAADPVDPGPAVGGTAGASSSVGGSESGGSENGSGGAPSPAGAAGSSGVAGGEDENVFL